ncbi:MAG: cupin domain-containing protein [Bacteroidales bacterium]|nr:cupin domain-containing protein [Bacteroidales bacterium]
MQKINLNTTETKEVLNGFHGKFIHTEKVTIAYWEIVADSILPVHAHPHEQIVNLIEGEFEIIVEDQTNKLYAGEIVVIPSKARHSGKAITHCKIIDVFTPPREDYKF